VKVWSSEFVSSLSERGKLVWVYLLTNSQTTPFGLYRLALDLAAKDLGMNADGLGEGFAEVLSCGAPDAVEWDENKSLILLPKWLEYNPPPNPNVLTSWLSTADELPKDSALFGKWLEIMKGFADGLGEGFADAMRKASCSCILYPVPERKARGKGKPVFNYDTGLWEKRRGVSGPLTEDEWRTALMPCESYRDYATDKAAKERRDNEFLNLTQWLIANPHRRKKNFMRFVCNWYRNAEKYRAQDGK